MMKFKRIAVMMFLVSMVMVLTVTSVFATENQVVKKGVVLEAFTYTLNNSKIHLHCHINKADVSSNQEAHVYSYKQVSIYAYQIKNREYTEPSTETKGGTRVAVELSGSAKVNTKTQKVLYYGKIYNTGQKSSGLYTQATVLVYR